MAKLTPLQQAQIIAHRGDHVHAHTAFTNALPTDFVGGNAALAELSAFEGRWKDVLSRTHAVLTRPNEVRVLNVYADMAHLTAVAAVETGAWEEAKFVVHAARAALGASAGPGITARIDNLSRFVDTCGASEYVWDLGVHINKPLSTRMEEHRAAVQRVEMDRTKVYKSPDERRERLFSIAKVYLIHDAAVSLLDSQGPPVIFDNVRFVASGLARAARMDEAWILVHSRLPSWPPVADSQVAPVVLLVDDATRAVMSPERCLDVLRTPRGNIS